MMIAITGAQNDGRPPGATRWSSATAPCVDPGPRSYPVRSGFARQNVYWSWAYRNWMSFDVPVSPMYGPAKK